MHKQRLLRERNFSKKVSNKKMTQAFCFTIIFTNILNKVLQILCLGHFDPGMYGAPLVPKILSVK